MCFGDVPKCETAVRKGVRKGWQYLANLFCPKRESGEAIPLIYITIQIRDSKKLEAPQGGDWIFAAVRSATTQLGVYPGQHATMNNFQKLEGYEAEALFGIQEGYGLDVIQRVPCAARRLATPILGRSPRNVK